MEGLLITTLIIMVSTQKLKIEVKSDLMVQGSWC